MQKEISGEDFIKELLLKPRVENYVVRDVAVLKAGQVFTTQIIISNCSFLKGLQILKSEFEEDVAIANCIFEGSHSDTNNDNHFNAIFKGKLTLCNLHVKNGISFDGCAAKSVTVTNGIFESRFSFKDVSIDDCQFGPNLKMAGIQFVSGEIKKFMIQCQSVDDITFGSIHLQSCLLSYGKYGRISFFGGCRLEMFIAQGHEDKKIPPFELNQIRFLQSIHIDSNITIGNVKLKEIECRNLITKCNIKLYNISFDESSSAVFYRSDLSSIEFNGLDFRNVKLSMENSYLSDTKFSNIKWPNRLYSMDEMDAKYSPIKPSPSDQASIQETYRQLKYANQKQGNKIISLFFYQKEMEIYWNVIFKQKRKNVIARLEDVLIVGANKLASNFGQNLLKPLALLLTVHLGLFLFLIMYWDLGVSLSWRNGNLKDTLYAIGLYFHTLNPAHRLQDVSGHEVYSITNFMMRVSSAFFIYHVIAASRKYVNN